MMDNISREKAIKILGQDLFVAFGDKPRTFKSKDDAIAFVKECLSQVPSANESRKDIL